MTKCIVITSPDCKSEKTECKKPISFSSLLNGDGKVHPNLFGPANWEYVELLCEKWKDDLDLMFAYDYPETRKGCLYLGHWNDGVV